MKDLIYGPKYVNSDILIKQMRIRKIKGIEHYNNWVNFVIEKGGLKPLIIKEKSNELSKTKYKKNK